MFGYLLDRWLEGLQLHDRRIASDKTRRKGFAKAFGHSHGYGVR